MPQTFKTSCSNNRFHSHHISKPILRHFLILPIRYYTLLFDGIVDRHRFTFSKTYMNVLYLYIKTPILMFGVSDAHAQIIKQK